MTDHDTTIREARDYRDALTSGDVITVQIKSTAKPLVPVDPDKLSGMLEALLAVIEQQQAIAEWLLAEQLWRMRFHDNDSLEIVNGWLVERGAHEPNFIPNYGYEPYTDAEPIVDLSKVAGWDDPDTLRATIDRQAETLRRVRERANDYADAGLARILDADDGRRM